MCNMQPYCKGVTVGNSACFTLQTIVRDSGYINTTDVGSTGNTSSSLFVKQGTSYKQV